MQHKAYTLFKYDDYFYIIAYHDNKINVIKAKDDEYHHIDIYQLERINLDNPVTYLFSEIRCPLCKEGADGYLN